MSKRHAQPKEPVVSRQDVTPDEAPKDLHKEYRDYYRDQTHLKPSTKSTLVDRLRAFPKDPKNLTAEHFRKRMKEVSPYTIQAEVSLAKQFLKWADRDYSFLNSDKLRLPRKQDSVTAEDLYTQEEIDLILANLTNYRDHAMISVLYESACRASELLSMTIENLIFEKDSSLATAIVKGKTGTREAYLMESVPSLRRWLNIHPTGKGKLWVDERKGHRPIQRQTLDSVVRASIRKAGLKGKKKVLHMFRHTRLTELVRKGVRGQSLSKIAGWTKRSNMEAVYVHLSTDDIKNEVKLKVFGLDGDEQPTRPIFESATCPDCRHKNPTGTKYCEKCNLPLSDGLIVEQLKRKTDLEERLADLQRQQDELKEYIEVQQIPDLQTRLEKLGQIAMDKELDKKDPLSEEHNIWAENVGFALNRGVMKMLIDTPDELAQEHLQRLRQEHREQMIVDYKLAMAREKFKDDPKQLNKALKDIIEEDRKRGETGKTKQTESEDITEMRHFIKEFDAMTFEKWKTDREAGLDPWEFKKQSKKKKIKK